MKCPIQMRESAQLLLNYAACRLDAAPAAELERHMEICPACREYAAGQRAVWQALDDWEATPVTADFDRRLYARIEKEVSWWDLLLRPFRPIFARQAMPVAAAAGVVLMAVVMMRPPAAPPHSAPAPTAHTAQFVEPAQAEQVERALDDVEMLSDIRREIRNE
ncbi:MAG TPA: zf-HC2 domain-containing protein [Bryobacteraceae bacterium]